MARRTFQGQFAALVKYRRRTLPTEEFVPMLNDFLKTLDLPPIQEHDLIAFEEDHDAGVPSFLMAYLGFMGASLRIRGVREEEIVKQNTGLTPDEEMRKKFQASILKTKKMIRLVEAAGVTGDFKVRGCNMQIQLSDGTYDHVSLGVVTEKRVVDLLKEAFVLGLYDQIKQTERLLEAKRRQLYERPPRNPS